MYRSDRAIDHRPRVMRESLPSSGFAELPHLATFAAVAQRGGFTAAAADLGITQAAVSQRIAALEKVLHVSLFDRKAARITLTEAGRRLYDYAQRILELHEQARTAIGGLRQAVAGELLIAASSVPGEYFLPALLAAFRAEHPHVRVRASVGDSGSVIAELEKGEASLGLTGQEPRRPRLEARPFGSDCLVLVVDPAHRWASRKRITLKALAREPLILREPGSGSRAALEKSLMRAGLSLAGLNATLQLGGNTAIKDAVKRGLGVAFLSRLVIQRELDAGELRAVAVSGLALDRRFYLVHDRRRPLSPAATAFLHFVETHPIGHAGLASLS
jgi:DNA-binding transcriptional LysR family regulator